MHVRADETPYCSAKGRKLWGHIAKASAMKTIRIALAGVALAAVMVSAAMAQTTAVTTYGGNVAHAGPSVVGRQMTPLATIGNTAVGIWTRVPPPYDATASYNRAANPLP
jgi:hypothetical protein